ncbi:CLUMA_CG015935, isoform A [Clunio marinus]|uniref:CLUMA_CG015935, isoform A n=1 Tax=Clunio marinus TaxID=568069 RepID=A0A1J1IUK4_9DIPT|nr:CLUMA_CG015935, isoform A [Clunio marinus]
MESVCGCDTGFLRVCLICQRNDLIAIEMAKMLHIRIKSNMLSRCRVKYQISINMVYHTDKRRTLFVHLFIVYVPISLQVVKKVLTKFFFPFFLKVYRANNLSKFKLHKKEISWRNQNDDGYLLFADLIQFEPEIV